MESFSYISTNSKIIIYFKIVNKNYRFEIILNNFYKEYVKNIDVFKIENTPFEKMLAIQACLCYYILS